MKEETKKLYENHRLAIILFTGIVAKTVVIGIVANYLNNSYHKAVVRKMSDGTVEVDVHSRGKKILTFVE